MTAMRPSLASAYVGSSGFSYPSWRGGFYPRDARPGDFLRLYAERLPSVELNTTFYRLPAEEQFRAWAAQAPASFRFAVKMTRWISHGGQVQFLETFTERVRLLGERLGPILVQAHPERQRDDGFLQLLLGSLDPASHYALELRDPTWDAPEVDEALAAAGVARVNRLDDPAPFRYLRLHEPPYDDEALVALSERMRPVLAAGVPMYAYFKHEDNPTAPKWAERLLELLGTEGG
jgi:uncharacterized protein YecE (DUF72 family)